MLVRSFIDASSCRRRRARRRRLTLPRAHRAANAPRSVWVPAVCGSERAMRQVVMVTGASAGVGRAVARAFGRRGARLGLVARGRAGLEGARRDVELAGGDAIELPTDVADPDAVE